jgi:hypothetical protein
MSNIIKFNNKVPLYNNKYLEFSDYGFQLYDKPPPSGSDTNYSVRSFTNFDGSILNETSQISNAQSYDSCQDDSFIYTASRGTSLFPAIHKLRKDNLQIVATVTTTSWRPRRIICDDNRVYIIHTDDSNNKALRIYDKSFNLLYDLFTGAASQAITIDKNGNVFISIDVSGPGGFSTGVHKVTPTGTSSFLFSQTAFGMVCDRDGNIYLGHQRTSSISLRKYDDTATLVWSVDTGQNVNDIDCDLDSLYVLNSNGVLEKRRMSDGGVIWSYSTGQTGSYKVHVGKDGSTYLNFITGRPCIKVSPTGTLVWSQAASVGGARSIVGVNVRPYNYFLKQ